MNFNKLYVGILFLIVPITSFSQKSLIKDINIDVKNNDNIIISYNLDDKGDNAHFIDFILIDSRKNVYIPENISGSIGSNVKKGKNSLFFNMMDQNFPLDQELTPSIVLDRKIKNGPKASLLSVMIPGLGDCFVENQKKMIIKPYYRTIAVGGFIALAFIADKNKKDAKYYKDSTWVEEYYDYYYHDWIPAHYNIETFKTNPKDYWLFKNDKEVFLGVAAAIWAFDIFWVYSKGQQNNRIRKALNNKKSKLELSGTGISYKLNLD